MDPHHHAGLDDEQARSLAHGDGPEWRSPESATSFLAGHLADIATELVTDPTRGGNPVPDMLKACRAVGFLYAHIVASRAAKPMTVDDIVRTIEAGRFTERERAALLYAVEGIVPV